MNSEKRAKLESRTIQILEKTKKDQEKNSEIRKRLFEYYTAGTELNEWEEYIIEIEESMKNKKKDH